MDSFSTDPVSPNSIPSFGTNGNVHTQSLSSSKQWKILIAIAVVFAVLSNAWVWTRPAVYQSQSIVYFNFPLPTIETPPEWEMAEVSRFRNRLTSDENIEKLHTQLTSQGIQIEASVLTPMLRATITEQNNTLLLLAEGSEKAILAPILRTWLELGIELYTQASQTTQSDEQVLLVSKIQQLDEKLAQARLTAEDYAQINNIVSLEREENRVINRLKSMSTLLDEAEVEKIEAASILDAIQQSMTTGQQITRPEDSSAIEQLRTRLAELDEELTALSQRYTPAYMDLDSNIIALKQTRDKTNVDLTRLIEESQKAYLEQSQRDLAAAKTKAVQLQQDIEKYNEEAIVFSNRLQEYESLNNEILLLETQRSALSQQLLESEVNQSQVARLEILQPPAEPYQPIHPDYWLWTFYSLCTSVALALAGLWMYRLIEKPDIPSTTSNHWTLVNQPPTTSLPKLEKTVLQNQPLLDAQPAPKLLSQTGQTDLITDEQIQNLYLHSSDEGKQMLELLLIGVSPNELNGITLDDVDQATGIVKPEQDKDRVLALHPNTLARFKTSQWQEAWPEQFDQELQQALIDNAVFDANLHTDNAITPLSIHHAFIHFILSQGLAVNQAQKIVGNISAKTLASIARQVVPAQRSEIDQIQAWYPLQ